LTALIFTAEGDMRQAINNLQSTWSGFGFVSGESVFKVCDQPHPIIIQKMMQACGNGNIDSAMTSLNELWRQGYSAVDIVVTIFRVVKNFDECVVSLLYATSSKLRTSALGYPSIPNWNLLR
jgi:replication factor C subunit 2/4